MTSEPTKRTVGRPRKDTNIKKRTINVYLPYIQMVEEWKALAKESELSISKFVIERVEVSLMENGEGKKYSRKDLIDRNIALDKENRELRKDMEVKSKAYDALDKELQGLRMEPFLNPVAEGMRELNKDLVRLFRKQKRVTYDEVLPAMGIKPTEIDLIKALNNQIEVLTQYALIKPDLKGWRWVE